MGMYLYHGLRQEYAWYSGSPSKEHELVGGKVELATFPTGKKALEAGIRNSRERGKWCFTPIRVS